MSTDREARVAAAVERACLQAATVVELCRSVHAAMSSLVPSDRWCGFAVDPSTLFATNGYHEEGVDQKVFPRLLEIEYGSVDINQLPALVRTRGGVATIADATGGDLAASARWRDVLEPSGLAHEMRAVFHDSRNAWGALIWLRGPDVADFSKEERSFVRRVAPTITEGFRRVLVRQHIDHGEDAREAGIVLLGGDPLEVRTATNAARYWLEQLDDGSYAGDLPTVVASAARAARAARAAQAVVAQPGRSDATVLRARTRTGRWLTITAEITDADGSPQPDVGVVVQPSRPAEIAQIVGAAHALTPRETAVVLQIASGRTNQEIARGLGLSAYTVGDHIKRVFAKLDVSTRGELTSKLFYDYHLHRVVEERSAGTDGWFLPD